LTTLVIANPHAVATPPLLMVFDILYRDGRDLTARPLRDRRARLEDVRRRQPPGVSRASARGGWPGGVGSSRSSSAGGGDQRRVVQ